MSLGSVRKPARFTFHPLEAYRREPISYSLLPFRFMRFGASRYVLVNEVGEFLFLDEGTFRSFATKALSAENPAYLDLKAKHFLSDTTSSPLLDVLATKYRTKKSFLRGFTKLHLFVVTLRCDHSCHYCQVSRQSEDRAAFDMKPSTARKAVDMMLKTPAQAITMEFQGGEPLLNFPLIKFMVEHSEARNRETGKQIDRVITTNLSKATPEILEYCRDHKIALSTSLDGPEWLHNANRPRPGTQGGESATVRDQLQEREVALRGLRLELATLQTPGGIRPAPRCRGRGSWPAWRGSSRCPATIRARTEESRSTWTGSSIWCHCPRREAVGEWSYAGR